EAKPGKIEEVEKGESVEVNGQTINGPVYLARQSTLSGVAFVASGADDNTSVAIAAKLKGTKRMKATSFNAWLEDCGIDTALMATEQLAGLHANYEGRSDITAADRAAVAPMIQAGSNDPVAAENHR